MSSSNFDDLDCPVETSGWFKSFYFAEVPEECADEEKKAGWLMLGVLDFPTAEKFDPLFEVRPEAGRMIIFPAYLGCGFNGLEASSPLTIVGVHLDNAP